MRAALIRRQWVAAMLLGALFVTPVARAEGSPTPTAVGIALAELPKLAPIPKLEPDPAVQKEVDRLLDRITADDEATRKDAAGAFGELGPSAVPAVRQRILDLRGSLDREKATAMLEEARKVGRRRLRANDETKPASKKAKKGSKPKEEAEDEGDWLDFQLAVPHVKDPSWRDLTRLLALERMLTAIGTTPAVRELVQLYAYFGELLRVDLQRQMTKLRDKSVPALIEARQHDAKLVQRWANKELDSLGRAIPGEAVGTGDATVLADVLRAYGRTRDVDAVRVILSFSNSDRIQLRDAAREAVAAIGEPGSWQLKDTYLGLTGQKPPREWGWDRIAREIFGLQDRSRMSEVYKLMDEGVALAEQGKTTEAIANFDKVLARAPLFERRREMVPTYIAHARAIEQTHREEALEVLRKALRLDPKSEGASALASQIAYLEGLVSIDRGQPDRFVLARAVDLDPANAKARQALAGLEAKVEERKASRGRQAAALSVGALALVAMLLIAIRRPRRSPASASPDATTPAPPNA